jgi:hypothetical protein
MNTSEDISIVDFRLGDLLDLEWIVELRQSTQTQIGSISFSTRLVVPDGLVRLQAGTSTLCGID